jgi:choline dehydrogenase-like flavoprotein
VDVITSGLLLKGNVRMQADVVIVGTGAGGAMAAKELAERGLTVLALEEGPQLFARDMTQREDEMFPKLYQDAGARMTSDLAIRVIGGRCIGGSTVHNINLCKRLAPEILDHWKRDHAVSGLSEEELRPTFESVERDLNVAEIPVIRRNQSNQLLERATRALGWRGAPLRHNRVGCQATGFCEVGCPYDAKQNAAKVLVPQAMNAGADVMCGVRAVRVLHDGTRTRGLVAEVRDPDGHVRAELRVDSECVVLAGSAIGSAALAVASHLPDPHLRLGRGLRLHPGIAVAGWFDQRIEGWRGIPQSYECTEHLDLAPGSDRRLWITTAFAHPIGFAAMLPGFGERHQQWMLRYPNLAVFSAMLHDETSGRVSLNEDGSPRIDYVLDFEDSRELARGVRVLCQLLFAAGAKRVLVPSVRPVELDSPAQIERIPDSIARPHAMPITAVHPMGTLALGDDPRRAVVKSTGEHHQVKNLFVLDGSLFPTSIGGPPQIPIYALSRHLSKYVAEAVGR